MTNQAVLFYMLLGAFIGLCAYLWERRHLPDLMFGPGFLLYLAAGAVVGCAALALLLLAAPGVLILSAQDMWTRGIPARLPPALDWMKLGARGATRTRTR